MNRAALVVPVLLLAGCASVPTGPSVMALPGTGKAFEQFQADDGGCRQWAFQQSGGSPTGTAATNTATGAAVGTAVGAALGAAIGAAAGNPALGAAVGAGSGLLGGTAIGAENAYGAGYSVQRRYDNAYVQCMYARGHQVPMPRGYVPAYAPPAGAAGTATNGVPPRGSAGTRAIPPPPVGPPPPPPPPTG